MSSNTIIFPSAEDLDTGGYDRSYGVSLWLVPADGDEPARVEIHSGVGNIGTPMPGFHGRWKCVGGYGANMVGASVLKALEEYREMLLSWSDSYEGSEWNGSNFIGQWSAEDEDDYDAPILHELEYYWDPWDWCQTSDWAELCKDVQIDPERGAEAVSEVAAALVAFARQDGAHLHQGSMEKFLRDCLVDA